jgi:hypothetical protein
VIVIDCEDDKAGGGVNFLRMPRAVVKMSASLARNLDMLARRVGRVKSLWLRLLLRLRVCLVGRRRSVPGSGILAGSEILLPHRRTWRSLGWCLHAYPSVPA